MASVRIPSLFLLFIYILLVSTVPSENKKDCRTIEQTMSDIRSKKRLKISETESRQVDRSNDDDDDNDGNNDASTNHENKTVT